MPSLILGITFLASVAIPTLRASNFEDSEEERPRHRPDFGTLNWDLPGKDLTTLLTLTQPGKPEKHQPPGDLRLRAYDLLSASTDLPDVEEAQPQKYKYLQTGNTLHIPRPPVKDGKQQLLYADKLAIASKEWVSKSDDVYLHVKTLRDESQKALKLVLEAADIFSALAKGLHVSWQKLQSKDAKMTIMEVFKDKAKWKEFLDDKQNKGLIDENRKQDWLADPLNATDSDEATHRQQFVQEFITKEVEERGGELPMDMMNKFDLPAWYEVELDWLKTYAKLFNAEGRNGPSPHMARNNGQRNVQSLQGAERNRTGQNKQLDALDKEVLKDRSTSTNVAAHGENKRTGAHGQITKRSARPRRGPLGRVGAMVGLS